jgi:16S rRNA processing protein RimM
MILLAVIAAAHGIQGAVKVKTFTQIAANIMNYGPLRDEKGREYTLKLVRVLSENSLIMKVKGVSDRNQAEALRGTKLYVERDQLPDLVDEEFYHSDLIGLNVLDLQGQKIGRVTAVCNFGAGDFLEIMDADHHVYTIPFTRESVPIIRLPQKDKEGSIEIDRQFLLDSKALPDEADQRKAVDKKKE